MGIKVELIVPFKAYSQLLTIIRQHKVEYKYANRVQVSYDIVQLVTLYCKKTCLTDRLRALRFFIRFAFPALEEKKGSWIISNLLHVLVCSIAEYFHSLFVFWLVLQARQNAAQLVKILSETTH